MILNKLNRIEIEIKAMQVTYKVLG